MVCRRDSNWSRGGRSTAHVCLRLTWNFELPFLPLFTKVLLCLLIAESNLSTCEYSFATAQYLTNSKGAPQPIYSSPLRHSAARVWPAALRTMLAQPYCCCGHGHNPELGAAPHRMRRWPVRSSPPPHRAARVRPAGLRGFSARSPC